MLDSTPPRSATAEPETRPGVIKCAAYEQGRCLGDVPLGGALFRAFKRSGWL